MDNGTQQRAQGWQTGGNNADAGLDDAPGSWFVEGPEKVGGVEAEDGREAVDAAKNSTAKRGQLS